MNSGDWCAGRKRRAKMVKVSNSAGSRSSCWKCKLVNRIRIAALCPASFVSRIKDAYVKMMAIYSRNNLRSSNPVRYHKLDP
ncbi:hypothetical protein KP509_22G047900 [Ceratopteris richardii]|nr:hypothetical protein KP509_22G047900 [Ceratopteris richardii]